MADTSDAPVQLSWLERLLAESVRLALLERLDDTRDEELPSLTTGVWWAWDAGLTGGRAGLAVALDRLAGSLSLDVSAAPGGTETVGGPAAESEPPLGVGA